VFTDGNYSIILISLGLSPEPNYVQFVALNTVLPEYFGFPLSVLFTWYPFLTFIYMLLLLEGKVRKAWQSSNKRNVVFFLLDDSPMSEFYVPMFRNTLSVPPS